MSMNMTDLVGKTIGQYRIEQALDAGGMGQVFRGVHQYLDRPAAIKVMRPHLMTDPVLRDRFLQEAKSAAALKHINIVSIYEFGEQDGLLYLVMELLTDGSLRGLLKQRAAGQYWPFPLGLDLVRQAADGLAAAHAMNVIHRDIKPDNMLLVRQDAVHDAQGQYLLKITDFGLARLAEGNGLTATGMPMGTLAYMSPEQWKGEKVDGRTDLYALGVVLYEVATGYQPFQITSAHDALYKHLHELPPPPRQVKPDISPALEAIILRCLEKNPNNRYATGTEVSQALRQVLGSVTDNTVGASRSPFPTTTTNAGTRLQTPSGNATPTPLVVTLADNSSVPRVRVLDREGKTLQAVEVTKRGLIVGRQPGNDITLPSDQISRQHLQIQWDGTQVTVKDLGSSNGTLQDNVRMLPQVSQPWMERQAIRLGPFWLRLEPANVQQGTAYTTPPTNVQNPGFNAATGRPTPIPSIASMPTGSGRFSVVAEPEQLTITPGQPTAVRVTVANLGTIVDWLRISVEGVAPEWVQGAGNEVQLNPGSQATVPLNVNVARTPNNQAQEYPVVIRARSREKPAESNAARGHWTVLPFRDDGMRIEPRRVTAYSKANYVIALRNGGNTPANYELNGEDDEMKMTYLFRQQALTLEPGREARVPVTVKTGGHLLGRDQRKPFQIYGRIAGNNTPMHEAGEFVSKPYIPGWVIPTVAAVLVVALALAALTGMLPFGRTTASSTTAQTATTTTGQTTTSTTPAATMSTAQAPAAGAAQPSPQPTAPPPTVPAMTTPANTATKFVQVAQDTNMGGDSTVINNALTNGNPTAIVLVTATVGAANVNNAHPIGVWYNGKNWAIFNEDTAIMPAQASFHVWVMKPNNQAFIQQATTDNTHGSSTMIDNPLTNNNPNAIIMITQNYNPNNGSGAYNAHNVGVTYDGTHWNIFNEDQTSITPQAAFNVFVLGTNNKGFIQQAQTTNISANITAIDNQSLNGDPNALLEVTQNWVPDNTGVGTYNDHPISVLFDGTHWNIVNVDQAAMPPGATFNVLILKV